MEGVGEDGDFGVFLDGRPVGAFEGDVLVVVQDRDFMGLWGHGWESLDLRTKVLENCRVFDTWTGN